MDYDVTGTLKIDTDAFEKALKDAQERINKFKKDLNSLGDVAKTMGLKDLDESLRDVDKLLDNVVADFGKADKSADNVVNTVKDLKKETDNVTKGVRNLKNETKQIDKSFLRNLTSMKRKMDELNESMALTKSKIKLLNDKSSADRRSLNYDRDVGWENEELEKKVAKHNELIGKEIQQYNQLKGELKELNKEYNSLMSSDNSLESKLTQLKHLVLESEKATKNMKKFTQQAEKEKELWLDTDGDDSRLHSKNYQGLKKLSDEQVKLFTEYRTRIKTLLSELVNDFGLSFSEIEKIMGKEISTKSVKDMASNLDSQIDFAKSKLDSLKRNLSTLQEKYSLIQKQITSQSLFHINHSRRNKDGSIHKRDQYNFERRIFPKQQEAEKILEKDFPRLANEIKTAETELARLEQLREKLISSSNFGKNADYVLENLEKDLRKKKESIEFWVNSIRELNEKINSTTNLEMKHSLKNSRNSEINILKERVKEYKQIKAEMESLSNIKELDKPKESLDNATKSAEHLKEKMNEVSQSSRKTADTVTTLDDFYNQATTSAEKLTAETKRTGAEIDALQRRISKIKLDKNFTKDFYGAVRSAEGGNGVELKPVYEKLKRDYKDLVKNKAEFEKLFSNAVQRTNTRLYPSRDPDKHTNIGGRNFGYIDRKSLISLDEFNKLMDKADAKVKQLNGEMQKTSPEIEDQARDWKRVGNELIKAKEEAMRLNDEMRNLSLRSVNGEDIPHSDFEKATAEFEKQKEVVRSLEKEFGELRKAGEVPIKIIEPTKELAKVTAEFERLKSQSDRLYDQQFKAREEGNIKEYKRLDKEINALDRKMDAPLKKMIQLRKELTEANISEPYERLQEVVFKTTESVEQMNAEVKKTVETSEQLDEPFDQATSSAKKLEEYIDQATASAEKLNAETKKSGQFISPDKSFNDLHNELLDAKSKLYDLKNEAHRIREEESGSVDELKKATTEVKKQRMEVNKLQKDYDKVEDNVRKLTEPLYKKQSHLVDMLEGTDKSTGMRQSLTEARAEYRELLKQKKELQAEMNKIIADNGGILTPEITEANKKLFEELHHIDSLRQDRLEDTKSYPKEIERVEKKIEQLDKEIQSYYDDAGKYLEGMGEGAKVGEEKLSEFDAKLKQQHEGLDKMLNESTAKATEGIKKVETSFDKGLNNIRTQISQVHQRMEGLFKFFRSGKRLDAFGKWFDPQINSPSTNRWIHEQLSTTRDFFKGFTQGFAKLKREQSEAVVWMNELHTKMEELRYGSRDFINTEVFTKAKAEADNYMVSLDKIQRKQKLVEKYNPVGFNRYGAGFLGDANIQKDIQLVNEFNRVTREVSASTNRWVNQEITDFNRFSQAVQKNVIKVREEMNLLNNSFRMTGNVAGVGFAGSSQFQNLNNGLKEYNRLSNLANVSTNRMSLGFEKFGQYTEKASSSVRSFGGVLRTLRTTMSMIGGMFVWEFAFKIMDSVRATISAKSEMESYYKTLGMGSQEIASFNKSLDNTISQYQKMNKFQLGETISALGVEFKMNTQEMNQIMKVAPMIVNEYLRAGRSTEEAILAIKDISQGEFLRLSRETGVGAKEIKAAGWSGDNKDILSLYQALEKIGSARHWDVFAQKAQSLNDVMLITENRMTEFMTLLSDAVTPAIVGSFNAMGDAFNTASRWYEGLNSYDKATVQLTTLGTVGVTTATVFNSHLLPAMQNFGRGLVSSFLGVDSAIVKEKGLSQAIAHETAVERIANIERKNGGAILHSKIMTLKEEELANKLGMSTKKLKLRYENLENFAMAKGKSQIEARTLAQRSLILAEEQNITTTQAMTILLEEESLAEMGTFKALLVRKMGLDATTVSEEGMLVAMSNRLAESMPYTTALVSETLATIGLESATATLVVTLGLVVAPLIAIGLAVVPLMASFLDLQKSYEDLTDTFEHGQERIDKLEEKNKAYQKTVDSLKDKTNLTKEEEQKLDEARRGLTDTTYALEEATKKYNKSVEYNHIYEKNLEKIEGKRAENLKEINKQLQTETGDKETIDSTYAMTSAYNDQYRMLQVMTYEENKRPERFDDLSRRIKQSTNNQEEYNSKVRDLGNEWNKAYDDMEEAQRKQVDASSDMFTRLGGHWDEFWAKRKMDWLEFWADPWEGFSLDVAVPTIDKFTGFFGFEDSKTNAENFKSWWNDFEQWFNDSANYWGDIIDDFTTPFNDFLNSLSVGSDFDPIGGWMKSTNEWLNSLLPHFSVDDFKNWFGTNIRQPFQQAWNNFWKNPFGEEKVGTKTFDLKNVFNFNFSSLKSYLSNGFRNTLDVVSPILQGAGQVWSSLGLGNGIKAVDSIKQGLFKVKDAFQTKLKDGTNALNNIKSIWGNRAYSSARSIYDKIKSGIGDIVGIIKGKLDAVTTQIRNIKDSWSNAINDAVGVITSPFNNISIPFLGGSYGVYGYRKPHTTSGRVKVRSSSPSRPVYGRNDVGFETVLRTMLTSQGFRSPSSYQFYANSQKSVQEAWDSGKANCFDGANLIVALGNMFGLKGHIVTGDWNGTGHSGAVVGGKLYDMTQFQRRGVFRGTRGVHFGSPSHNNYGASNSTVSKDMNITINMSNATIYGMSDFKNKMEKVAEDVFIRYHDENPAIGV